MKFANNVPGPDPPTTLALGHSVHAFTHEHQLTPELTLFELNYLSRIIASCEASPGAWKLYE